MIKSLRRWFAKLEVSLNWSPDGRRHFSSNEQRNKNPGILTAVIRMAYSERSGGGLQPIPAGDKLAFREAIHERTSCTSTRSIHDRQTNPGRNYEVVGEVRVSSAADIAVAVRKACGAIYAVIRTSLVICLALFTYLANGYA